MNPCGWFSLAFAEDVALAPLTPARVGARVLMLVAEQEGHGCFDAICPHRGANLAFGGIREGVTVKCPFHGLAIALGECDRPLFVTRHPTVTAGGMVFAQLGDAAPLPLPDYITALSHRYRFVSGFALHVRAAHTLITENAFDALHFLPVHKAAMGTIDVDVDADGVFVGHTEMTIPSSPWLGRIESGVVTVPLVARAFGSGVVISEIGGSRPYVTITGATPIDAGNAILRLTMGFPLDQDDQLDGYMINQARQGIEADCAIWEQIAPDAEHHYVPQDKSVIAFADYCRPFLHG